jgi:hypothetical protein
MLLLESDLDRTAKRCRTGRYCMRELLRCQPDRDHSPIQREGWTHIQHRAGRMVRRDARCQPTLDG